MSKVLTMLQTRKPQDEYMTPPYAVKPLLNYIARPLYLSLLDPYAHQRRILCPFDKADSAFVKVFHNAGYKVTYSHIDTGKDFFSYTPEDVYGFHYIISNPPFSVKDRVFEHLFYLGRPFAMLQGVTSVIFEGKRFGIFKEKEFEIMWLRPRVNYVRADGVPMKGVPFQSCYVCHNVLPKAHILHEFNKKEGTPK